MKKTLVVLGALLLAVLTAGLLGNAVFTTSSDDSLVQSEGESSVADSAGVAGDSDTALRSSARATTEVREPAIIRTGSIGISTDRMTRDLRRVRALASELDGAVTSESSTGSAGDHQASLTLRVPNTAFDTAMTRLGEVGEVTHREVSSEDVTTQVIDVKAKVDAQRASVASLQRLMTKARTVGEVMSVERELATRQGELDSLLQQQRYLADQTSMSTIEVSLSDDPDEAAEAAPGFLGGLQTGWAALGSLVTGAATLAGLLLPFLPLVLLVGVPVWLVTRRRRARASQSATQPG